MEIAIVLILGNYCPKAVCYTSFLRNIIQGKMQSVSYSSEKHKCKIKRIVFQYLLT